MTPVRGPSSRDRAPRWALGALYLFTVAAVAGYGIYALHPELIPASSFARSIYRSAFPVFSQVHIVLAAVVLAVALARRGGLGWLPAVAAVYVVSFLSEHVGTGFGLPFGEYRYTSLLGPKIGGRVPWLIPLSWFLMALPSYALARHAFPERRAPRLALAVAWLVAWDLALDPAMSHLTPYWVWGDPGPYYGMPLVNVAGWAATGAVLMGLLEAMGARERVAAVPAAWMAGYWAAMTLMPLGMLIVAERWLAVVVTGAAAAVLAALTVGPGLRRRSASGDVRSGREPAPERALRPGSRSPTPAGGSS